MLDVVVFLLGLLGLAGTWRFLASVALGVVSGIVAWQFELLGAGKTLAVLLIVIGAVLGAAWQVRHERRHKGRAKA